MIRVAGKDRRVVTTAETMAVKRNETVVGMAEKSPVTATRETAKVKITAKKRMRKKLVTLVA